MNLRGALGSTQTLFLAISLKYMNFYCICCQWDDEWVNKQNGFWKKKKEVKDCLWTKEEYPGLSEQRTLIKPCNSEFHCKKKKKSHLLAFKDMHLIWKSKNSMGCTLGFLCIKAVCKSTEDPINEHTQKRVVSLPKVWVLNAIGIITNVFMRLWALGTHRLRTMLQGEEYLDKCLFFSDMLWVFFFIWTKYLFHLMIH